MDIFHLTQCSKFIVEKNFTWFSEHISPDMITDVYFELIHAHACTCPYAYRAFPGFGSMINLPNKIYVYTITHLVKHK